MGTFHKYTDHQTGYCSRINLALASDSQTLAEESLYIQQLRDCIQKAPLLDLVCAVQGFDCCVRVQHDSSIRVRGSRP